MKSDTVTVQQLFQNQLQYWVPFYQRAYTWKQGDQWAPLWDDVVRKADQRRVGVEPAPHFLGAVVLEPQVKAGFLGVDQLHIIDGQQRLTTLQFLLMGLKLALIELGHSLDASQAVNACVRNSNVETMKDPETETFKLWPTFRDREVFTKAMQVATLADLQPRFKEWFTAKGNLSKAVNPPPALGAIWYFATAAKEWMRQEGEDKLAASGQALVKSVLLDLKLVSIVLEKGDDAQVIFETINSRGVELHATDLIRNFIFMTADRQGDDAKNLYEEYWKRFEAPYWSTKQRRGRMEKPRIDWLIHSTLQARLGHEVELNRLYQAYRRFANRDGNPLPAAEQLQLLNAYAAHYQELLSGSGQSPIARFGHRIRDFDVTTLHPLALLISTSPASDAEKSTMFDYLVSYLVRRAVCGLTPKNYNNTFLSILRQLDVRGVEPHNLRVILSSLTGDISRWPSDLEFEQACLSAELFPGRMSTPRMRMMLTELEDRLRTKIRSEEAVAPRAVLAGLDVDHVLPQAWSKYWELPTDGTGASLGPLVTGGEITSVALKKLTKADLSPRESAIAARQAVVPTLGNLTLLNLSVNREAQNFEFQRKRELLLENTVLRLNTLITQMTREGTWDETAIAKRGALLASEALSVWVGPPLS